MSVSVPKDGHGRLSMRLSTWLGIVSQRTVQGYSERDTVHDK